MGLALRLAPRLQVPSASFGNPKIDWTHPLAQGLIGCFLPGVCYGLNLAGQSGDLIPDATTSMTIGQEGPGAMSASSGSLAMSAPSSFYSGNTYSSYFRAYILGNSAAFASFIGVSFGNGGSSPFVMFLDLTAGSGTTGGLGNVSWNTAGVQTNLNTSALSANTLLSRGASWKVGGNAVSYNNGASTGSAAFGAGAPSSSPPNQFVLGTGNMIAFCGYWYNRELSAAEFAFLDSDPYGMFLPSEGEMPAISVISAGFKPYWAVPSNYVGGGGYAT